MVQYLEREARLVLWTPNIPYGREYRHKEGLQQRLDDVLQEWQRPHFLELPRIIEFSDKIGNEVHKVLNHQNSQR